MNGVTKDGIKTRKAVRRLESNDNCQINSDNKHFEVFIDLKTMIINKQNICYPNNQKKKFRFS